MKKTFCILTAAIALASASTAAPTYTVTSPVAQAPAAQSPVFTFEAIHNFMNDEAAIDTTGIRIGAHLYRPSLRGTFTHQYSVNLGYAKGTEGGSDSVLIPLTVGYNANTALSDKVSFYAGVKAGCAYVEESPVGLESEDDIGLHLSVGAGLKFQLTEATHVQLGYEIGQVFPSDSDWDNFGMQTISLGVGIKF